MNNQMRLAVKRQVERLTRRIGKMMDEGWGQIQAVLTMRKILLESARFQSMSTWDQSHVLARFDREANRVVDEWLESGKPNEWQEGQPDYVWRGWN